ncbi:hypothetical protein [Streptomyces mirabilis]
MQLHRDPSNVTHVLVAALPALYGEFIERNPDFFARTERRVVSY